MLVFNWFFCIFQCRETVAESRMTFCRFNHSLDITHSRKLIIILLRLFITYVWVNQIGEHVFVPEEAIVGCRSVSQTGVTSLLPASLYCSGQVGTLAVVERIWIVKHLHQLLSTRTTHHFTMSSLGCHVKHWTRTVGSESVKGITLI